MSYHRPDRRFLPPSSASMFQPSMFQPTYPLPSRTYPLAQVEAEASALASERGITIGKVLLVIVVIAAIVILLRKLSEGSKSSSAAPVKNPVDRATTQQLARKLYERLYAGGSANPDMMRSLAAYSKPKSR